MRSIGKVAFLFVLVMIAGSVAAIAADTPGKGLSRDDLGKHPLLREPYLARRNFQPPISLALRNLHVIRIGPGDTTCYYIHSFYRKRIEGSGVTVPAGESMCTPASRLRMKQTHRVRVLPAIDR